MNVGSHIFPAETSMSGGGPHISGMVIQTNTSGDSGTWVDRTSESNSKSSSLFDAFPAKTAENCLYIGGDLIFPGFKVLIDTIIEYGSGSLITEYLSVISGDKYFQFDVRNQSKDISLLSVNFQALHGLVQSDYDKLSNDYTETLN